MSPFPNHYYNPYQVTINGNGTIYYTTDGSTPTISSSSAVNNVQISIDQNKEIKAFLVNGQGSSSPVISKSIIQEVFLLLLFILKHLPHGHQEAV